MSDASKDRKVLFMNPIADCSGEDEKENERRRRRRRRKGDELSLWFWLPVFKSVRLFVPPWFFSEVWGGNVKPGLNWLLEKSRNPTN